MLIFYLCVYVCGDIIGFFLLVYMVICEVEVVINYILGIDDWMDYDCVLGVVYINFELVGVGKMEEELIVKGIYYWI